MPIIKAVAIDQTDPGAKNLKMSVDIKDFGFAPSETTADLQAVIDSMLSGQPLDPAVERRVSERAEKVREELRKRPPTDIAVDLIRESRADA